MVFFRVVRRLSWRWKILGFRRFFRGCIVFLRIFVLGRFRVVFLGSRCWRGGFVGVAIMRVEGLGIL